jgi:hypothetical protein
MRVRIGLYPFPICPPDIVFAASVEFHLRRCHFPALRLQAARVSRQVKNNLSLHASAFRLHAGVLARPLCGSSRVRRNRNHAGFQSEDIMTTTTLTVKFIANDKGNPPGKLADAELHFSEGPLEGLKLIGFSIWERRTGGGRNVTFPARQYSVNGERRTFALLRPITDSAAQDRIRDLILSAWTEHEAAAA